MKNTSGKSNLQKRSSHSYPEEFLRCFLQAKISPVIWNFPTKSQAISYRNYLYQFRAAYIAEERRNFTLLASVSSTIAESTESKESKESTYNLTLQTRSFIAPANTSLLPLSEIEKQLTSHSVDVELTQEQIIAQLEVEGKLIRDESEAEADATKDANNPYLLGNV